MKIENIRILLETKENVLNSFKSSLFPIENVTRKLIPDATPDTKP